MSRTFELMLSGESDLRTMYDVTVRVVIACPLLTCTGFKHQVRVHLADGLRSPVLGDYKFGGPLFRQSSYLNKKMKSMKFVPGKVYLHASELEIPDYHQNGKTLIIRAPLPEHFCKTAKLLRLQLPTKYL